jgi:transcriptional regulator with XRE-family HTH domain
VKPTNNGNVNDPDKTIENIGRRVAEIRLKLGLTQDALAEKAGVTGGYIRQIEGGWKNMRVNTLCKIADILGCQTRDLFETPTMKKQTSGRPRIEKPQFEYKEKTSIPIAAEKAAPYRVKTLKKNRVKYKK